MSSKSNNDVIYLTRAVSVLKLRTSSGLEDLNCATSTLLLPVNVNRPPATVPAPNHNLRKSSAMFRSLCRLCFGFLIARCRITTGAWPRTAQGVDRRWAEQSRGLADNDEDDEELSRRDETVHRRCRHGGPEGHRPELQAGFQQIRRRDQQLRSRCGGLAERNSEGVRRVRQRGGGFVVVHAADNCFPEWPAYNEMIGLGGWGGRTEKDGPYVYVNDKGEVVRDDNTGQRRQSRAQWEFPSSFATPTIRSPKACRPNGCMRRTSFTTSCAGRRRICRFWRLRNLQVTGRNEPMIFTIDYGKGRVFHTPMGHAEYSDGMRWISSRHCNAAPNGRPPAK